MPDSATAHHDISFIRDTGEHRFWNPDRSGTFAQQSERGRIYAKEIVRRVRNQPDDLIFGSVLRSMVGSGTYGPVEIGFCAEMSIVVRFGE
jgi:hypothetical protein